MKNDIYRRFTTKSRQNKFIKLLLIGNKNCFLNVTNLYEL